MTTTTITITTIGSDAEVAARKVQRRLPEGVTLTGSASSTHGGRLIALDAEVADHVDRDDLWVALTSYGLSPEGLDSQYAGVEA